MPQSRINIVAGIIGFVKKALPIKYLGCNLFNVRKKIIYFNDLVKKVEKKLAGWKCKLLFTGGR